MDWQILLVWLVLGAVVISVIARWFLRRVSGRGGDKENTGEGKPPCCG